MVSYYNDILSNVDVGVDDSRVDDGPFADENVITDLQWEKCNTEKNQDNFRKFKLKKLSGSGRMN